MDLADYLNRLDQVEPELAADFVGIRNLEQLLTWFANHGTPLEQLDMVTQDEFCHDLMAPLPDGRWMVFGLT